MVKSTYSAVVRGIDGELITCEVDVISSQLPSLLIVGLPDKSVQEAKERIVSAIKNSGFEWPRKKIVVNLAPADIQKNGTQLDLAIAIAILSADQQIEFDSQEYLFLGELALDGSIRKCLGVLPMVIKAESLGIKNVFIPYENATEASMSKNSNIFPSISLLEIIDHLKNKKLIEQKRFNKDIFDNQNYEIDFSNIVGQETMKRASMIAVAGGHNILFVGTPGSGKTLISRALPSIMPKLTYEESLELTKIYSVANLLDNESTFITKRPFRSPHHTSSTVSIIGGGKNPRPGEVTLAHRGILFLDEFTEFSTYTIESLRQPIEDKKVSVSRVSGTLIFPSNFMLVAAMNPCKCGWLGDPERQCSCTPFVIEKYKRKISGPILDRIDLQIPVKRTKLEDLANPNKNLKSSKEIQKLVQECRNLQQYRYKEIGVYCNSDLSQKYIEKYILIEKEAKDFLINAANKLNLSTRSFFRIMKVARTIADLEKKENTSKVHIAEAMQYRIEDI